VEGWRGGGVEGGRSRNQPALLSQKAMGFRV